MAIVHYEGELGIFDYDDDQFEINEREYLRYIGKETDGSKIHIPEGITNCGEMFFDYRCLQKPPVIPDGVKDCRRMFAECKNLKEAPVIPKGVKS